MSAEQINGQCLCGAVTVSATVTDPVLRACHCDMCRALTSGMFMSLTTDAGSLRFSGPFTTYTSSEWANRGFCGTCGSTLFYEIPALAERNVAAGLFKNAANAPLTVEFFADMCPQGYTLAGDHRRLSTPETIAMFAPVEGDDQ